MGPLVSTDWLAERAERMAQVAPQGDFDGHDFAEFRAVDIGMYDGGFRGEAIGATGNAVVEAHSEREHDVRLVNRQVRGLPAVHAQHSEKIRIAGRGAAEAVIVAVYGSPSMLQSSRNTCVALALRAPPPTIATGRRAPRSNSIVASKSSGLGRSLVAGTERGAK